LPLAPADLPAAPLLSQVFGPVEVRGTVLAHPAVKTGFAGSAVGESAAAGATEPLLTE
jgi:hypothetical protein